VVRALLGYCARHTPHESASALNRTIFVFIRLLLL
jgi:hypothetical protein